MATPYNMNTENSLPLAQGWQTPTAQPSSISSIISNLLYQSQAKPANYWNSYLGGRWVLPSAYTVEEPASPQGNQKYVTGSTIRIGGKYWKILGPASSVKAVKGKTKHFHGNDGVKYRIELGPNKGKTPIAAPGSTSADPKKGTVQPAPVYVGAQMSQASLQALQLADAYFSPKRLELAYQLEQMDTDMRRLAVNLGRQVDDPILQARLYKEAMKQTRQMDTDQQTFGLQMVEQRRKEEMQNSQFYAQLGLESQKTALQNTQFYQTLGLEVDKLKAASEQYYAGLNLQRGQIELANKQFYAGLGLQMGQTQLANQQFYANMGLQMGQTNLANQQFYANLGLQTGQTNMANQQFYANLGQQGQIANNQTNLGYAQLNQASWEAYNQQLLAQQNMNRGV